MRTAESGDTSRKVYSRDGDTTVDARLHNVAMVPGNDDSVFVGWFACVKFFFFLGLCLTLLKTKASCD